MKIDGFFYVIQRGDGTLFGSLDAGGPMLFMTQKAAHKYAAYWTDKTIAALTKDGTTFPQVRLVEAKT